MGILWPNCEFRDQFVNNSHRGLWQGFVVPGPLAADVQPGAGPDLLQGHRMLETVTRIGPFFFNRDSGVMMPIVTSDQPVQFSP